MMKFQQGQLVWANSESGQKWPAVVLGDSKKGTKITYKVRYFHDQNRTESVNASDIYDYEPHKNAFREKSRTKKFLLACSEAQKQFKIRKVEENTQKASVVKSKIESTRRKIDLADNTSEKNASKQPERKIVDKVSLGKGSPILHRKAASVKESPLQPMKIGSAKASPVQVKKTRKSEKIKAKQQQKQELSGQRLEQCKQETKKQQINEKAEEINEKNEFSEEENKRNQMNEKTKNIVIHLEELVRLLLAIQRDEAKIQKSARLIDSLIGQKLDPLQYSTSPISNYLNLIWKIFEEINVPNFQIYMDLVKFHFQKAISTVIHSMRNFDDIEHLYNIKGLEKIFNKYESLKILNQISKNWGKQRMKDLEKQLETIAEIKKMDLAILLKGLEILLEKQNPKIELITEEELIKISKLVPDLDQ